MKSYKFRINGNQYEAEVLEIEGNIAKIEVNGTLYNVEMQREIPKIKTHPAAARPRVATPKEVSSTPGTATGKSEEIKAPLPGVILQVLVKQGDDVIRGQTLCTLETMKMENAINAEKAGKATSVRVNPGQSVLQDEVLIVMSI
jgi:biotin carboxyl carrier protein